MRGSASSILTECRELSTQRVAEMATQLMDWVPGMLTERAQKETEPEQKGVFYRAREEARGRGLEVAEEFRRNVAGGFDRLVSRSAAPIDPTIPRKMSARELTLVDHEDLSESIKVRDLIRVLAGTAGQEIAELQPRIALLVSAAELSDSEDPLSPHSLCNSFRAACEKFDRDVRVRMVVLDVFQNEGIAQLEGLYHDLNTLLVEREVLPVASFRVKKGSEQPSGGVIGPRSEGGGSGGRAGGSSAASPDLFALLQGLVAHNGARIPAPSGLPLFAAPATNGSVGFGELPQINFDLPERAPEFIDGLQLMSALTRLQQGDFAALPFAGGGVTPGAEANLLHGVRSSDLGRAMGAPDAGTLDIVARLFDQIFSDATITPRLRALISRLQFPLLKVALIDKTFFSDTQHPARCMLDLLSEFIIDPDSDADDGPYEKLEGVVERLLRTFVDDVQVFVPLVADLRAMLDEHSRDANERARQAAAAVERKELRRVAKRRAYEELKRRAAGRSVPKVVIKFLVEEWLNLLYLAYGNKGEDSPAWRNALTTLDQLIWSLEPKTSATERRELAAILPRLLKQLRAGMRAAGTTTATEQAFLTALMRRHTALIEGKDEARNSSQPIAHPTPAAQQTLNVGSAPANRLLVEEVDPAGPQSSPQADAPSPPVETSPHVTVIQQDAAEPIPLPEVRDNDELVELDFTALITQSAGGNTGIQPAFVIEEVEFDAAQGAGEADAAIPGGYSAADLRIGDWIELERTDGPRVAAKLSFISPNGGVYLFTSRGGTQLAELRFYEVARALRDGSIKPFEQVSVFDRAVSGLISVLRAQ